MSTDAIARDPETWVLPLTRAAGDRYASVRSCELSEPLDVLGVPVRLADVLDQRA